MVDYALFHPNVWRNVCVDGTLHEFLSTAMYEIVRRVCIDPGVGDDYPSFERSWRSEMATKLKTTLSIPPDALCPSIHRVIPVGVSPLDAMQAMEMAVPKSIQNPYVITVQTSAVDDMCGAIAISQPMQYTVVNVNCMINPGLLVDVCRELRAGHRSIVSEVQSMNQKLSNLEDKHAETNTQLSTMQDKLSLFRDEMKTLVTQLASRTHADEGRDEGPTGPVCSKAGCHRVVKKRFKSGKAPRQCSTCLVYARTFRVGTQLY
jgi:hypothetical protein